MMQHDPLWRRHSMSGISTLKRRGLITVLVSLAACGAGTIAQSPPTTAPVTTGLRAQLLAHLAEGQTEEALRLVQESLRAQPGDAAVRAEYIHLHLALAELWLAERRFADSLAALEAVLTLDAQHAEAARLRNWVLEARERAGAQLPEIDRLLDLELFEAALDLMNEMQALRPDLSTALSERRQRARLGAADDHYLARNFAEAFALYESLLAEKTTHDRRIASRWLVCLALALGDQGPEVLSDPNAAGRLLARTIEVLELTDEIILGQIIGAQLAERAGDLVPAGRTYAAALGVDWQLPAVDQRREAVAALRQQAITRARQLYDTIATQRRDGFWAVALPEVWKDRAARGFVVRARNDLVAERVARAAERHYEGISAWLGRPAEMVWNPPCTIHVHASQEELHAATQTRGITFAVSHTRVQGERVLTRELHVFQGDPWLLSSTLPHELTHLVLAEALGQRIPPLAIDEGLALQAEPPARRLLYRLRLGTSAPSVRHLLAAETLPREVERFYADSAALTAWLLDVLGAQAPDTPSVAAELARRFAERPGDRWWAAVGLATVAEAELAWRDWYAGRREPYRMPLMIMSEPASELRTPAGRKQTP